MRHARKNIRRSWCLLFALATAIGTPACGTTPHDQDQASTPTKKPAPSPESECATLFPPGALVQLNPATAPRRRGYDRDQPIHASGSKDRRLAGSADTLRRRLNQTCVGSWLRL